VAAGGGRPKLQIRSGDEIAAFALG